MAAKVLKNASVTIAESLKQWTLNKTDIEENSNKCYNLELIKDNKGKYYLYSNYGRTGGSLVTEFRPYCSEIEAEREGEKIIKSKLKKGYVAVELAKTDIGSDKAKEKILVQAVDETQAKKLGFEVKEDNQSSLHPKVQGLMKSFFGALESYVSANLNLQKCSLGQLSLTQIDKGRTLLLEARQLVKTGAKDISELNAITSKYYSNIPMNFGYQRLDANTLRLDNDDKLDKAFDFLETLESAKNAEKVLYKKNAYDEQYKSLKTGIDYVEPGTDLYKWIEVWLTKTKASNHHYLNKIKPVNIFKLDRPQEQKLFLQNAESYAKSGIHRRKELPDIYKPIWNSRFKYDKEYEKLMEDVNILPLWHGTKHEVFPKILPDKMRLPRKDFQITGNAFGNGSYFAANSTKSSGYSSYTGSIWANGGKDTGFLFLADVVLGKQHICERSYQYDLRNISPALSVWAKSGPNKYLYNDEFIIFKEDHTWLKYIIEFNN